MNLLKRNNKAMFFTVIAVILLSIFLLSFSIYSEYNERTSVKERITTLNNFIFSLEKDISRQGYISGYRALLSLGDHITSTGQFIPDSRIALTEAIINGSIEGNSINLMEGYRLPDLNQRISEIADKMHLFVNYSLKNINITQEDPWNVNLNIEMELFIIDKNGLASWNKTRVIVSKIEITDFEDPLYVINTNGFVVNKVIKNEFATFVSGNNVSNLTLHVNSSKYIASNLAPSFLDRLEGRMTPNEHGIESLVNLPKLSSQGIDIKEKSVVDYIYFSSSYPSSRNINGMPSWFRLDEDHLETYGVEGLVI
jgi:hypothetical protein